MYYFENCRFTERNFLTSQQSFKYLLSSTGRLLMIEIIFVRLATHLRFYVGTLDCQIQI
jgi:hypothetical protein